MADEWIKLRRKLRFDGRVRKMSRDLRTNVPHIIGCLSVLWMLADEFAHDDGRLEGYEKEDIDAEVGVEGFCKAVPSDWFEERDGVIYLPEYQEHNGSTAKRRAEDAKRKRRVRTLSAKCPENVRNGADVLRTREEKRRIEENTKTPLPPLGENLPEVLRTDAFRTAWAEWLTYRTQARIKTYTEIGLRKQLKRLKEMGHDRAIGAIEHSIANGYRGIYDPGSPAGNANRRGDEAASRRAARIARDFAEPEKPIPFLVFGDSAETARTVAGRESQHTAKA